MVLQLTALNLNSIPNYSSLRLKDILDAGYEVDLSSLIEWLSESLLCKSGFLAVQKLAPKCSLKL
jgi:hypothetical protein